ncbi:DUF421 domain-containing protein [Halolactibacillus alkaliphilus]|uniref:DUF421 domain-containing protein n=1 Tax=Halolactibacillus alkaliphilus TaxID=442899 RepID=A0A511WY26_9BACI|nr:YetF domain-containing protein [Halolactibacillus alkaliphilus]GEN56025.1 DUF421 domain-containing protein [Halolactibacillus alkaliphilus]GGN68077.1 DUF421 domain-containing protein [Halolactibacillus alkaliphilus]SFO69831.1 Uncharacterized membrane protein YcaP, DUF421 family [Halolactibacillus alkaliphilus]
MVVLTIISYLSMVIVFRLMGKREVGELSIFDVVIFMMIAELGANLIEDPSLSFTDIYIPIGILVVCQRFSATLALKIPYIRQFFDGEAVIIYREGKFNLQAMRKERYSLTDFIQQLHDKDIRGIQELDYALLESSGKLTAFKKTGSEGHGVVYDVILYGKIQKQTLRQSGLTEQALWDYLKLARVDAMTHVLYLSVDQHDTWFLKKDTDIFTVS